MAINIVSPSVYQTVQSAAKVGTNTSPSNSVAATGEGSFSNAFQNAVSNLQTTNLDQIFEKAAADYHVPVGLLKAVAKAESNFNPLAESGAGAQGIMQLMPATARSLGVTNSFDPEQNIMGGAKYLSQMLDRYDGNQVLALAAYNAGPGNVKKYNGVPPFQETQRYITKVLGYAGSSITAGSTAINTNSIARNIENNHSVSAESIPAVDTGSSDQNQIFQDLGILPSGINLENLSTEDFSLFMNLYRYRIQMDALTEPDSGNSNSDGFPSVSQFANLL